MCSNDNEDDYVPLSEQDVEFKGVVGKLEWCQYGNACSLLYIIITMHCFN